MLGGNDTFLIAGLVLGTLLMGIGAGLGFWVARRGVRGATAGRPGAAAGGVDQRRVLQLLQELEAWTSEYAGSVSRYQDQLGRLTAAPSAGSDVMVLLREIMHSNQQLQTRLDAAEKQLDKQTRQIESYLTEARTDALTGLSNRRALDQRLEEMLAAYRKGGKAFVLALIDIDHFKQVNDRYGHPAGDEVLRQMAAALTEQLEGSYLIARFGGEEFAVLLPPPLKLAGQRLDKLRKTIAARPIDVGTRKLEITISAGLSEVRDDVVTGPLIRRADEALYAAKGIGRNRIYFHDGQQPVLVGAPEVAQR